MVSSGYKHTYVNAPAIPPAPAPIRARSKTERFFMRDWILGLFLDVGFSHFGNLGVVTVSVETAVDARGMDLLQLLAGSSHFLDLGRGFKVGRQCKNLGLIWGSVETEVEAKARELFWGRMFGF